MNSARKEQILYQVAHGQGMNASPEEKRELRKYRVSSEDGQYATKANIRAYIKAVDKGYRLSFYDWCMNNLKGDRRRRGFSKKEMATERFQDVIGSMMLGWLTWGMAIYWMRGGSVPVESCAVAGAIVSAVLSLISRRLRGFTLFLLPILLAVFFGR